MSIGEPRSDSEMIFEGDRILLTLDASVYGLGAVQKTGYRLAKRCTLLVSSADTRAIRLSLLLPTEVESQIARGVLVEFLRELGDQQLREQVREE